MVDSAKFSTFVNGGDLADADTVVGLRDGVNTRFTYSGGISPGTVVQVDEGGTGATTASGARTNLGLAIGSDVQAWSAVLDALSALSSTGFVAQTGASSFSDRTLTGTSNQIAIADGDGVSGNPTYTISSSLVLPGTITLGGNLTVAGYSVVSTAGGDIAITPDTTGQVIITNLQLATDMDVNEFAITNATTNGDVDIDTNGSGKVVINSTTGVDEIINDGTMATATAANLSTSTAIKNYVDSVAGGGFTVILTCLLGTTANLSGTYANGASGVGATLTNNSTQVALTIDGVLTQVGDRILVKDQTAADENGVYEVTTVGSGASNWVLTRTTDYDTAAEIIPGTLVPVSSGTVNGGSIWLETATVTTVGTDPIVFAQFAQPGGTYVTLATVQTISGAKTFSNNVVLSGSSTLDLNASTAVDSILDEDDMSSDSNTALATQQSIKSYVDSQVSSAGRLVSIQTITANGTWTRPSGVTSIVVQIVGGGGGSGGCATTGSSSVSCSGGGGGGGYSQKLIDVSALASETVTIGSGGAGGTAGATTGSTGGTTSFGALCTATGGSGGTGGVASFGGTAANGGDGGVGASGDVNLYGDDGGTGQVVQGQQAILANYGGGSYFAASRGADGATGTVSDGRLYGGGGAGIYLNPSKSAAAGSDGADGVCIVFEYS